MNCAISDNALSLELDSASYIEKTVSSVLLKKKDKASGEYISTYNQGVVYLPAGWVDCDVACILLEPKSCEDPTSMSPGKLILSDTEIYSHYGIIIQKAKKHVRKYKGKEYPTSHIRLPKGWVGKKVGLYKLQS